ncbi:MAG: hypothetical protein R3264_14740 [Anaerolineae bacterium]|nr:hypothetical protein [Anaerolineae bacterium]
MKLGVKKLLIDHDNNAQPLQYVAPNEAENCSPRAGHPAWGKLCKKYPAMAQTCHNLSRAFWL